MIMHESTETPPRLRVWDLPVRVFHWALAISFAGAYVIAESDGLRQVHVMFGYTVLGLITFRLIWGFIGTRYARFSSFLFGPRVAWNYVWDLARGKAKDHIGHNPVGSYAIYAILILAVLTGISGYCNLNHIGGDAMEGIHETAANLWLAVVFVHVAGVIVSSFVHRQNLIGAMITGYKRGTDRTEPAAPGSPARIGLGVLTALAVLTFWLGSLLNGATGTAHDRVDSTVAHDDDGDES
jgi:cytochrome b